MPGCGDKKEYAKHIKPWHNLRFTKGEVAEWLMAADCKSALLRVRWFESIPLHQ